ncbi:hypothetical protein L7F22_022686 [Adiantum nelumboides]|nr:hypothetical protein [Adiantum nelumboides]
MKDFEAIQIQHISCQHNKEADNMANTQLEVMVGAIKFKESLFQGQETMEDILYFLETGRSCQIYLPKGLLDRLEVPAYLTGEVPGDYGFDPFSLSKKAANFDKLLTHSREVAMLGALGFVIREAFNKYGASCGPEAVWFKTGALILDRGSIEYFGATIPINLVVVVIAKVVLVDGAEYYRASNLQGFDRLHLGGPFDPLVLAKDPDQFALLKVKEIKNGRLAMFSLLGFFLQAYVTGQGPVEYLAAQLSDPFANNLLIVHSGSAE